MLFYVLVDFSKYEEAVWPGRLKLYSARHLCEQQSQILQQSQPSFQSKFSEGL